MDFDGKNDREFPVEIFRETNPLNWDTVETALVFCEHGTEAPDFSWGVGSPRRSARTTRLSWLHVPPVRWSDVNWATCGLVHRAEVSNV